MKEKNADVLRILLESTADPAAVNSSKQTPLQYAKKLAAKDTSGAFDSARSPLRNLEFSGQCFPNMSTY